jgi:hypothetical protein
MPGQGKPELSVTGLIAGAAATVTATVASSYFGVGGTLIGAGAVSVLSTVGATVYQRFLDRGKARLAARLPVRVLAGGRGPAGSGGENSTSARTGGRPWPRWYVLCGAAAGIFVAVMGVVTTFELVTGKPLSNTVQGRAGRGTSVHPVRLNPHRTRGPAISHRATPDVTTAPSAGPTAERTPLATPTPPASATPAESAPGTRSIPTAAATPGPAVTRSSVPEQAPPEDDSFP